MANSKARAVIDAWSRKMFINSMGEVFLDGEDVLGSINLWHLEQRLGRTPTQHDCDAEFDRQARAILKPTEFKIYKTWGKVAKIGTDLVRFYVSDGRLTMNTEFVAFVRDKEGWKKIKAFVNAMGMTMEVMETRKHLDKWKKDDGPWQTGPDHGKWERQVDCIVDITGLGLRQVERLKAELMSKAAATGADKYWVSVL